MRRTDKRGQPLGGQQQLGGVFGQALLAFASTSQVHEDVVVIREATDFIIWQACLKSAERTDDDTLGGVAKVYDLVEAFGTNPVTTLQHFGFPLFQIVSIITDLTLQLVGDLRLCSVFQRLTSHLELCVDFGQMCLVEKRLRLRSPSEYHIIQIRQRCKKARKVVTETRNLPGIFSFYI